MFDCVNWSSEFVYRFGERRVEIIDDNSWSADLADFYLVAV